MRTKILVTAAAAFVLSSLAAAPFVASAQPSPSAMKKAGEIKDPAAADAAVSKLEAKDARKKDRKARKSAKVAAKKAEVAAKEADAATKAAEAPH